jgi:hypothetical protein
MQIEVGTSDAPQFRKSDMQRKCFLISLLSVVCTLPASAHAQDVKTLSLGTYRAEGKCAKVVSLGSAVAPSCDHFMGVQVELTTKPMFIFPFTSGEKSWFFVASGQSSADDGRSVYKIEKLYDAALNAEFSYPAGECEITTGPTVHCTVWKDESRITVAKEIVFASSGQWLHQK